MYAPFFWNDAMHNATYTLLVLDDDSALRGAIRHWAGRQGYRVHTAASTDEARSVVAEKAIDLALLDIRLPDGDGIELAESLIQADPERPIILMTAFADLDSARKAIRIGAFEFFAKPLSFESLEASVASALKHRDHLIENRRRRTSELEEMNDDLSREIRQRREGERVLAAQTRSLSEANDHLQQKDRLLTAYQGIAKIALSSLDLEEIVDSVGHQLVEARIFRQLVIALVDEDSNRVEIVKQIHPSDSANSEGLMASLIGVDRGYPLDGVHIAAQVARTGEMKVVDGGTQTANGIDDQRQDVAFFVPIKTEVRVIGVLGVVCPASDRVKMRQHIEMMRPMLDQVAFALDHALLFRASQNYARVISDFNSELESEIKERKRAEEAVVRLERLGALGEMSAGVSHNLNNILTGVLGPSELIKHMTDQEDVLHEAELIRTSAMRARDLVMRLHESVRGEREKVGAVNLDTIVEEAIVVGRPRWKDEPESQGRSIQLQPHLQADVAIGATDPGLRDLVLNLLFNAADALTAGGTIHVSTEVRGANALLHVSDDGVGMDEETRRRVFEPFFTTKANVGTGLGLSSVYGTLTRWGGNINVQSEVGEGSHFEVVLPLWATEPRVVVDPGVSDRTGRVLVVEDEETVRDVVNRVLGRKHDVSIAEDGQSALAAMATDTYDVVLIDLGIPDMPGDQIAARVRDQDPLVTTVLMTGWSLSDDDPRTTNFDLRIQKPFESLAHLVEVVDQALHLKDQRGDGAS
jgi:signal transduction histidine kinase/DNA-binding response OmpR family regulator